MNDNVKLQIGIAGKPGEWYLGIRKESNDPLTARFQRWRDGGPIPTMKGWVNNPEVDFDIDDLLAVTFMMGKANLDRICLGKKSKKAKPADDAPVE